VLPDSWGRGHHGPRRYPFLAAGQAVRDRYLPLGPSRQLHRIFETARLNGADHVYVDSPYIDLDYRSDLAHFYTRAFRPPPDTTERLLFARDNEIIGVSVIRPLPQPVGRTMMAPPPDVAPYLCCTTAMDVHAFGYPWSVSGFPFMSQDGEYGVCAHAAIWAIARYHNLRFGTDRHTISGIIEAAGLRERTDRTARSLGLYATDIMRAFRGIGLPALSYDTDTIPDGEDINKVICRYLNSGIPVGVLTDYHMMVICGYGEREDESIFYFLSDDNLDAYVRVDTIPAHDAVAPATRDPELSDAQVHPWKMLLIPLPGRIHVSGEAAEARAEHTFEDRVRANVGPQHLLGPWENDRLRVRTYATPSWKYVNELRNRGLPPSVVDHHIYAPKAGWLWVSEFQDMSQSADQRVLGEIAIDATSLQLDPSPVFGNIDGWAYIWTTGTEEPHVIQLESGGAAYRSAVGDRRAQAAAPTAAAWPPSSPPVDVN
jgi:hypothetical protein